MPLCIIDIDEWTNNIKEGYLILRQDKEGQSSMKWD